MRYSETFLTGGNSHVQCLRSYDALARTVSVAGV